MKRNPPFFLTLLPAIVLCGSTATAFAQTAAPSAVVRGDATGTVGWLNVNKSALSDQDGNDWFNRGLYGGAAAGWYWTDHHKTEVEVAASNKAQFWAFRRYVVGNVTAYGSSRYTFSTRRMAIGEHYQFFRNAWFHPHVAAGVDLTWETATENSEPVIAYPTAPGGQPRVIRPEVMTGPDTTLRVRPFGEVGFKAYMTPRGFFRSDLRLLARHGIDEVQLRFGFGMDF